MDSPSKLQSVSFEFPEDSMDGKTSKQREEKEPKNLTQSKAAWRMEARCKMLAALVVFVAFIVHLIRILTKGSDTCSLMFNDGWWRGDMWQPYGCMMHRYVPSEARTCLQNHPVAFVGDSRIRGLYYKLVNILDPEKKLHAVKHHDLHYKDGNTTLDFYWRPYVDQSVKKMYDKWIESSRRRPHLIITGMATWTIKNLGINRAAEYQKNLTLLKESIEVLSKLNESPKKVKLPGTKLSPFPTSPTTIWTLQAPTVFSKLSKARKSLTISSITKLNDIASNVFFNSSVKVLQSIALAAKARPKSTDDGVHYNSPVIDVELDFLLNFYCNRYMQVNDASCCLPTPRITQLQYNTFAVFVTCFVLFIIMFVCRRMWPPSEQDGTAGVEATTPGGHESYSLHWVYSESMYPVMRYMAKLGIIMLYFYLCDRTNLFFKEQKQYSNTAFFLSMLGFLVLGAYTWTPHDEISSLNRDQTDEWKGWMQLVILLYHYIGASQTLPIYVFIRLLVASYLFMSGYGHFLFFWTKGDYSLFRFCQVMTRMNLFTVVLCLVMGRPYQFYYFVPLISFWFVVIYATMVFFPRVSASSVREDPKQYIFIWLKFFVLFGTIYILWSSPILFDWVFSQWAVKQLFIDENDSVREWRFRSWLDRYIVLYGMVFGFAYHTAKHFKIFDDTLRKGLFKSLHSKVTMVMSVVALAVYGIQAFTCSNKPSCNATHSVASCIPITAYILLRNVPGSMRSRFSRFYAWVGSISLELFIGQYHIWLAQDTRGVLVLIPGYPALNAILTSFVFVCVCHEVNKVTSALSRELVSKDLKTMLRRLVVFVIMLIVIWWHKTHHALRPRMD
ncbi:N-acetylneuraminate 9-O-acetyltransferase [Nematostella vectensis]|uniref:N-acetylneuraminate 9-O-acetyltransferase n=1 Tax=Nematostella vectensis TaxID=45351 RepID=UPI002077701D|nr:N-acetylneuraminate 9-O-acetyltransferase [Nematostella vectensis]